MRRSIVFRVIHCIYMVLACSCPFKTTLELRFQVFNVPMELGVCCLYALKTSPHGRNFQSSKHSLCQASNKRPTMFRKASCTGESFNGGWWRDFDKNPTEGYSKNKWVAHAPENAWNSLVSFGGLVSWSLFSNDKTSLATAMHFTYLNIIHHPTTFLYKTVGTRAEPCLTPLSEPSWSMTNIKPEISLTETSSSPLWGPAQ